MSIGNPIIQRELISVLRTRRALVIQLTLIAALGGVVLLLWPQNAVVDFNVNLDGHQSKQIFRTFTYGLLVCMLLLAPVFPATTIVRERDARTLQLLLTSRLSPWSIVFGKIAAAVGFILLLLVLSLPPAAACYTMGGVDFANIAKAYMVLTVCAVQYALIGLLISSFARSSDAALRMTYGAVLAMSVLPVLPFQLLHSRMPDMVVTILEWIYAISPIPAIMEVLYLRSATAAGASTQIGMEWRYIALAAVSIVLCIIWLNSRLQPKLLDRSRAAGRITDDQTTGVQRYRRVMFLSAFDPQKREQFIGLRISSVILNGIGFAVFAGGAAGAFLYAQGAGMLEGTGTTRMIAAIMGCAPAMVAVMFGFKMMMALMMANPVIMKEFRSRALGRSHWMMRLIAVCLIVSLALTLCVALFSSSQIQKMGFLGGVLVIFQMGLVLLIGPALSTALISAEVESGGWELMQMTRLRASHIILGKLISVTWTLVLLLLATVPGYVALLIIDAGYQDRVINVLICLGLTALFTVLLSAGCSSVMKRTTAATSAAYIIIVLLCVGTFVPWLGQGILFGHSWVEGALRLNPVATALSVIDMPGLSKGNVPYNLARHNWQFLGGASVLCAITLWVRTWWLTRPR